MWHRYSNRSKGTQAQRHSNIEIIERIEIKWTANGSAAVKNIRIVIESGKRNRINKNEGNQYKVNGTETIFEQKITKWAQIIGEG